MRSLPPSRSADETFRQLCETLDQVEDEWSGVAKRTPPPAPAEFDGRMYCPFPDFVERRDDGGILATTRGHRIEISATGTIKIIHKATDQVEFEK
jgi:hypothetical protein